MIELELFIVFYTTVFFTLIYVIWKELLFGIISFGGWLAMGMMWFFINPMDTGYTIALFFHGIGILFLLTVIVQYLRKLDLDRHGLGDDEEL